MFLVQVGRKEEVWFKSLRIKVWNTSMEPICMDYLYGTLVWNTCMEIPPCLGLGRKNPIQSVFFFLGCSKFFLRLVCFWLNDFW